MVARAGDRRRVNAAIRRVTSRARGARRLTGARHAGRARKPLRPAPVPHDRGGVTVEALSADRIVRAFGRGRPQCADGGLQSGEPNARAARSRINNNGRPRQRKEVNGDPRSEPELSAGDARRSRHPVRRRLRRRHAARRRPVHEAPGGVRQRPRHLPDFPAEIRAPAGTIAGVSSFQVHISDHEISTPGDTPNVLVAMNPAALKANLRDIEPGLDAHRERRRVRQAQPRQGRLRSRIRSTTARSTKYRVYEVPMTSLTVEAHSSASESKPRDAERSKNFFALGLVYWMYNRPTEPMIEWIKEQVRQDARDREGEHARLPGRLQLRRDRRDVRPPVRVQARARSRRARTATSPATRRWPTASSPPAQQAKMPLFLGSIRSRRRRDILHELSKLKNFGVNTFQAEDEIAGIGAAVGARLRRRTRRHRHQRPGRRLKGEAIGLAISSSCRWSSSTCSAAALARVCRPRPSRPTCCWRCTAATARRRCRSCGAVAGRLLRRRVRGRAHRAQVPHAGHPAHRRLPRQRRRAVAPPRRRRAARHLDRRSRPSRQPRRRVPALPARPRRSRAVGRPRHAGARAPHRRPREGGRHRQRQLRAGEPRTMVRIRARPRSRASPRTSRLSRSTTPTRAPSSSCSVGAAPRRAIARAKRRVREARGSRSRTPTCAT